MTKMKIKFQWWHTVVAVVVLLLLFKTIFPTETPEGEPKMIEVKFYDENKNLIQTSSGLPQFAIVNNIPNVAFVTFTINVMNDPTSDASLDNIQLTASSVTEAAGDGTERDTSFENALTSCKGCSSPQGIPYPAAGYTSAPGETISFGESDYLNVQSYSEGDYIFYITISSTYEDAQGATQSAADQQGSVILHFELEVGAVTYTVDLSSSGDIGKTICTNDPYSPDCSSYCPPPSSSSGDYCCDGTTEYYKPRCDLATKVCDFSKKANSANCGGTSCTDDCSIDFCAAGCGWVLKYAGRCTSPLAAPGSQCSYSEAPDTVACGGAGDTVVKTRISSNDFDVLMSTDGNWIVSDSALTGDGTGMTGYGWTATVGTTDCTTMSVISVVDSLGYGGSDRIIGEMVSGDGIIYTCKQTSPSAFMTREYITADPDAPTAGSALNTQPTQPYAEACQEIYY